MAQVSQFNHFRPWPDGNVLAFNAASGALALMTGENYTTYSQLADKLDNGAAADLDQAEQELMTQLAYGGFIHDGEISEIDRLKFRYRKFRYNDTSLGLVIAPTMACNMACPYCFEGNKKGRMTPRVVESILTYIEDQAPRLERLEITWYGGEPLLAMDIIEDLTESILDLAVEYDFEYVCSGIITNGFLMDREMIDRLAAIKVGQVQVTVDGPSHIHDLKRPLKNGKGSFSTIIGNLTFAIEKLPIVVRINIDKSFTRDMLEELLDELDDAGLRGRAAVYFGQLEPATPVCSNISESCFESRGFSNMEVEYYRRLLERGFLVMKLPSPIMTFCFAQRVNSFLIDPSGDLYRCFNYAGDKTKAMGNVSEPVNLEHTEFARLFAFDPFEDEQCRSCSILPLCMGSCPSRRADRPVEKEDLCDSWKYNLESMLELVALSRQQQAQAATNQAVQEAQI